MQLFTIEQDANGEFHLKCPRCNTLDRIAVLDSQGELNTVENVELSDADVSYAPFVTATCRSESDDPDWEPGSYGCRACGSLEIDQPDNFEITEWIFEDD